MSQPPVSPRRPPGQPTPRQPVRTSQRYRPPADPVLQQRAWAGLLMSLVALFGLAESGGHIRRGVYVIGIAIVIAAAALWLATTAMTRARRIGSSRPRGAVFGAVLGSIGIALGALVLIVCAMFWPQVTQYSSCESAASTTSAQHACYQQFRNAITSQLSR